MVSPWLVRPGYAQAQGPVPSIPEDQEEEIIPSESSPSDEPGEAFQERLITMDFNNVDLTVFIKFISEIVEKNVILDERVRGKVTILSPVKIPIGKVYEVFLSVMDLKGFAVVEAGETIQILPASEVHPEREIFLYFLKNANADEIAKLLAGIVSQPAKAARTARKTPQRKGQPTVPRTEFESQIQITPDKDLNALIIRASSQDYEKLVEIIDQLDIKRRQVYVEAVIMEVAEDELREFGSELGAIFGYVDPDDIVAIGGLLNAIPSELGALTDLPGLEISDNINVGAVLTALMSFTDVNILSTPQILTLHNQKARIVVGQNVPFVTGSTQTTGGVVTTTVSRQDVGVSLELTPQVMEGDRVRLEVRQEISSLADTAESVLVEIGPTTNKREAMTSVIVENHQTVVIGGLIRDDYRLAERKIPLLGDIPLIGWLFRFQSKSYVKTNLLIFLTPHILTDPSDFDRLRKEKTDEIEKLMAKRDKKGRARIDFLETINSPASDPER